MEKTMNDYLKITSKDATGTDVYYIKIKNIESFSCIKENMYSINMLNGHQFQVYKQFSTINYNSKTINWDKLPEIICNG